MCASRLFVALALALASSSATAQTPAGCAGPIASAICAAVERRLGGDATVDVKDVDARLIADAARFEARPAPGTRVGEPARFLLHDARSGARVGEARATVQVTRTVARIASPVARGARIGAEAVEAVTEPLDGRPLSALPTPAEVVGARALRDLQAGEIVTSGIVRVEPLVSSGQRVTIVARIGEVVVEGQGIAAQDGGLGDIVRLVNADSKRPLRGRVVDAGRVEVFHEP